MSRSLMLRFMVGAVAVAMSGVAMEQTADAGLFGHRNKCRANVVCCDPAPVCCEAAPVCCEAAPVCCEKAPVCCEKKSRCNKRVAKVRGCECPAPCKVECEPICEPVCEVDCCTPKRKRSFGLFKLFRQKGNCCEPVCGC